jgi:hypothetical protein
MKRIVLLLLGLLLALPQFAQERKYSTFYEQRATLFEELPVTSKDIIFLGNSITNGCEWAELFQNKNVKNRGISGDIEKRFYKFIISLQYYTKSEQITIDGIKRRYIYIVKTFNDLHN